MAHPITTSEEFGFELLKSEVTLLESEKQVSKFIQGYNDDFWQKTGEHSLLPPGEGADKISVEVMFGKRYVTRNVLAEGVNRVSNAFLGKAPNWYFRRNNQKLDTKVDEKAKELSKLLDELWTRFNLCQVLIDAFNQRLVAGRGGIHIYIAKKYIKQNKVEPFNDIEEALKAIRIEAIEFGSGRLLTDDGEMFSILIYKRRKWDSTQREFEDVIEFSLVDDDNLTFIGTLTKDSKKGVLNLNEAEISDGLDLDGYTTFFEIIGKPYITESVFRNNQFVNLALTCGGFNVVDNGFGEMVTTNVDLEKEKVPDPSGENGYIEVPKKIRRGGGVLNNFIGLETTNLESGEEKILTPGVHFREPSSMQTFKEAKDLGYESCLEELGQKHALITGDGSVNAVSRIQALTDFLMNIKKYKPEIDQFGTWLLTVIVRMAAIFSGNEDFKDLSILFESKIYLGPLTPEEKNLVLTMRDKGIISAETARVLLDIDNPEMEKELIAEETKLGNGMSISDFDARLSLINKAGDLLTLNQKLVILYPEKTPEEILAMQTEIETKQAEEAKRMFDLQNAGAGF